LEISVLGSLKTVVSFEQHLSVNYQIDLFVLKNASLATHLVIGRNFLDRHSLLAVYCPPQGKNGKIIEFFSEAFPRELL
jgi:hypothetical protein